MKNFWQLNFSGWIEQTMWKNWNPVAITTAYISWEIISETIELEFSMEVKLYWIARIVCRRMRNLTQNRTSSKLN